MCGRLQLRLIALQGSSCSLFLAAQWACRAPWNPVLALGLLSGMGSAAVCVFFLGMSCFWMLAESYSVYLYVQDVSVQFKSPLHLDPVPRVFLLRPIKVAVHQFLIGAGLINEQLRGAVVQLQLPDTNIASLCQGIQLSCISNQYLLLSLLLLP